MRVIKTLKERVNDYENAIRKLAGLEPIRRESSATWPYNKKEDVMATVRKGDDGKCYGAVDDGFLPVKIVVDCEDEFDGLRKVTAQYYESLHELDDESIDIRPGRSWDDFKE